MNVLVVFYSMTGNTGELARALAKGASEAGADVRIRQVAELIPEEKFDDRIKKAKKRLSDIEMASKDDLVWADGIAFGSPTRYGNMTAQLKNFIDQTGDLWMKGALIDKVATFFTGSGTQHGGIESTILTSIPPMLAHGMIYMGVPYSEQRLRSTDLIGSSVFGSGAVSGPANTMTPSKDDLEIARTQGMRLARLSGKMR